MNPVLYSKGQRVFNTNGLGVLSDCVTCKATEVLNKEYEIEMTLSKNGNNASKIDVDQIVLVKANYTDGPQPFRIYSTELDIDGNLKVNAAHWSYDMAGIPVDAFTAESLTDAVTNMNANQLTTQQTQFLLSTDFESEGEMKVTEPKSFKSLLGDGEGTLIGTYGGEYHYHGFDIELLERRGTDKGICFRYRKNITDFEMETSSEESYTAVMGFWKKSGSNDEPDTIIKGTIISLYDSGVTVPYDKILIVDTSDKIKNENDADATTEQVDEYIQEYIEANDLKLPTYNMKVEYTEDDNIIKINLGDTVAVLLPEYGVKAYGRCSKVVFDCLLERNESIEIGSVSAGIPEDLANII